ncbi:ATP phosphoribosyltransferase [Streptomyces boncukensis]|uniref:ATP phosphoribosyltransferase n=1 Tax=Streptomyces boncukensis TaxID=2711219 RepID=A0A6G4WRW4_9ACTN|nr:ATP phosphoribosyltransferase [Streptomyces boncukensis]NGO67582.1 ATP phosphoribosyltransferase [Streptomyces boncukensis]
MLRVAVPNKGALSEPACAMLREAGYRQRHDRRDLVVLDEANDVEFFFLRPRDIAVYVGEGRLDLGVTGRDLALDSGSPVEEELSLGFGGSTFRYAVPAGRGTSVTGLAGCRLATSYPRLVADDLAARNLSAEVIRLEGAVETAVQLGVAEAVADVVSSGSTLRQHGLVPVGEPICVSEAVLVRRRGLPRPPEESRLVERLRGVVLAQQYVMLDYDCPRDVLEQALKATPGLQAPTVAPLADPGWTGVRAMVRRGEANQVMDEVSTIGARAVLASDIRFCRL